MEEKRSFEEVFKIDVSDRIEKKNGLSYLSWSWAWAEFKKLYPTATYEVQKFNGLPYVKEDGVGAIVYTSVTADGLTYEMWLPVMDNRNNAILQPKMTEINKAIMRCLTKNLAMFGLGLYVYTGEDLPEDTATQNEAKNTPKTGKKSKDDKRLTKKEFCAKFGIIDYEKTIAAYEQRLGGVKFEDWVEETFEVVEADIKAQLKRKEAQRKLKEIEGEVPFAIEGK